MSASTADGARRHTRLGAVSGTPITTSTHLVATGLRKSFGSGVVLDDVSLAAAAGDRLAVIGDNGCGKSTLLRILAGQLAADAGTVNCTTTRSLVEQELHAAPDATVQSLLDATLAQATAAIDELSRASAALADGGPDATEAYELALAVVDDLDAWDAERRLEGDLDRFSAELPREHRLASLSPGQRYRLRLACALHHPGGAVLLDEPSNHLDDEALDRLAARLLGHPGVVVLVTHDRWLLDAVATKMLDLDPSEGGGASLFGGTFAEFRKARAHAMERWREQYAASLDAEERLRAELAAAQERAPDAWRPEKGSSKHGRASRISSAVREVRRRLDDAVAQRPSEPPAPLHFDLPDIGKVAKGPLLTADHLRLDGRTTQPPAETPLQLMAGGRLRVAGPNGAGKSSLLALLAGAVSPNGGYVQHSPDASVGWLHQEDELDPALTALDVLAPVVAVRDGRTASAFDPLEAIDAVRATGLLRDADLVRPIGQLSVGQRRRVDLARIVLSRPSVLLLDEPTNHLSVTLVDELTEALVATPAAVVLVTHDRTLLARVADWPVLAMAA